MTRTALRLRTLSIAVMFSAALLGCADSGPGRRGADRDKAATERAERLSASAYQPAEEFSLTLALQTWTVQGETLPVSLAFPGGSARGLPLVVYLPGLGESAQAGLRWRQAWARAGFAVLSLQPLDADARAWSSDLARAADFKALAREHQQPEMLHARLERLSAALAEARQRAAAGDSLWRRVDFNAVGIAGYDLGVQAALAPALMAQAKAVVALSPVVSIDAAALAGSSTPLLMISSRRDSDPTGLFADAAQRGSQIFEQWPAAAGGKSFLLMLNSATHGALSGSPGLDVDDEAGDTTPSQRGSQNGQQRTGRHHGNSGGNSGAGSNTGNGDAHASGAPSSRMSAGSQEAGAVIQGASIAFLDATLRARPQAQAWLQQDAPEWLKGLGEWVQR